MRKEDKNTIIEQIAATVQEYGLLFGRYNSYECCCNK